MSFSSRSVAQLARKSSYAFLTSQDDEILFKDICVQNKQEISYKRRTDSNRVMPSKGPSKGSGSIMTLLRAIFLPEGYPESVSEDYFQYQVWDTFQAFCSSITGTLSMRAVLQGVGVGSQTATPASAAITWIMKDGSGMIGSILFAWSKGSRLDTDCKKWRLFADILNDFAMCFELLIPNMLDYSIYALCVTSTMKALVGVAGGATRAALMSHQAVQGNTADVSAKDGSQEIFVNLCASILGIFILKTITVPLHIWVVMCTFTILHLLFNYKAVSCLRMHTLNAERFCLTLRSYLATSSIPTVDQVNRNESVILGRGATEKALCGYDVFLGSCLKQAISSQKLTVEDMCFLTTFFQDKNYLILPHTSKNNMIVTFRTQQNCKDVLKAYFHAVFLGLAINIQASDLTFATIQRNRKNSPIFRLKALLSESSSTRSFPYESTILPVEAISACDDLIEKEFSNFFDQLGVRQWNTDKHSLLIDVWRGEWVYTEIKRAPSLIQEFEPPPKKSQKGKGSRKRPRSSTNSRPSVSDIAASAVLM